MRLGALVWSLGFLPVPIGSGISDTPRYLEALHVGGFVLSGGNDFGEAPDRDTLEYAVLDYAARTRRPVLGICRGLQVMNLKQGGSLIEVEDHVAVQHTVEGVFLGGDRTVNSFHRYGVSVQGLGADLEPLAHAPDGTVEVLRHTRLPWLAVMWHPERNAPVDSEDMDLIRRHFKDAA